jgi:hypothetical protein
VNIAVANRNVFLVPKFVADPPRGGNPDREAQDITGDHPLEGGRVRVELLGEGWERDVDDGGVQDVHEQPEHEGGGDEVLVVNPGERGGQTAH